MAQQELRDDAGHDRDEYVVVARLDPLIPARRGAEIVAAPVIDYVLPVPVFNWQAIAAVVLLIRTRAAPSAAFFVVRASEIAVVVVICHVAAPLLLPPFVA